MTEDTVLIILNTLWALVLSGIGIEMVNNPPDKSWKKWTYRGLFAVIGLAVIVTTVSQAVRANSAERQAQEEASKAKNQAHQDEMASQAKLSYMQGTLDTIAKFVSTYVSHRPTPQSLKFDPSLAAAIMKMAQANATSGLTQTPQATTARPPRLVLHAEISSAPVAFHDGEIRGRSFGSSAGFVFLHLRIKPAAQNGPYAQYAEKLLGGLNATNYYPLRDDIVQNWSDTSIQLRFPKGYWQELLSAASNVAHTRNIPPPQKSDIQACYQVSLSDEEKSDYFCAE